VQAQSPKDFLLFVYFVFIKHSVYEYFEEICRTMREVEDQYSYQFLPFILLKYRVLNTMFGVFHTSFD